MSDSVRPHRWQSTRLPCPWDSPGTNTGGGCHFLLQCMKVKSESEVAQLCPTLSGPMDCNLPGSSIHGIFQAKVLEDAKRSSGSSKEGSGCLLHSLFPASSASAVSLSLRPQFLQREPLFQVPSSPQDPVILSLPLAQSGQGMRTASPFC